MQYMKKHFVDSGEKLSSNDVTCLRIMKRYSDGHNRRIGDKVAQLLGRIGGVYVTIKNVNRLLTKAFE